MCLSVRDVSESSEYKVLRYKSKVKKVSNIPRMLIDGYYLSIRATKTNYYYFTAKGQDRI